MAEIKTRPGKSPNPTTADEVDDFLKRAHQGDASTLPVLREMLNRADLLDDNVIDAFGGELARQTERSLIECMGGKNLAFKEALRRKMEVLRTDLAGPNPTPLEKLLAERVALCWLSLHEAELRASQSKNQNWIQADHWQRHIDHAHRRYLSAIKTLATIRKLALPVLQVNIAKRQTNIVAGTVPVVEAEKGEA